MKIAGRYFDGKTSARQLAELELLEDARLCIRLPDRSFSHALADLNVSERIGNTQRRIRFPDGAICELEDNDALDLWLQKNSSPGLARAVFALERHWRTAVMALAIVIGLSWGFVRYGIPVLAEQVAYRLPTSVDDRVGAETLEWLDKSVFTSTRLPADKQQAIRSGFTKIVGDLPDRIRYRLEFRHGGKRIGANAFALPSGQIVVTDELVELAQDPNEITAVLLHEVGHVVHRHALRMLLQSSATALMSFALLGDLGSVSSLTATMPAVLLQAKYSREHEAEADDFAYAWMGAHGIAAHYFGDMLARLEKQHSGSNAMSYFSSHPQTEQRVRR